MGNAIVRHMALPGCMLGPALALAETGIPYRMGDPDIGGLFSRMLLGLGLLCAVAAVVAVFVRRRLVRGGTVPEKSGARIRVADRRILSRKAMAHLLEIDGRDVLVVESEHGIVVSELAACPATGERAAGTESGA